MKRTSSAILPSLGRRRSPVLLAGAALLLLLPCPSDASAHPLLRAVQVAPVAQPEDPGPFRIGLTFAGTGFVSLALEHQWGDRSAELTLGTVSFRDVSISLVGKQYFSGGTLRPFVGLGLWSMVAFQGEATGAALIARAPVGAIWEASGNHFVGAEMSLSRALAVRRVDPEDERPPNPRIVPIPAIFYRYRIDG